MKLDAPFPWFGGKRKVAAEVWARFGRVDNYVEPFFGSGAVMLGRPEPIEGNETINDLDGFVANFWRSIKLSPEATAEHADNPVNENDLHARHVWLVKQRESLRAQLDGDPDWHDPKIAGFWVWGISCWIGGGFCSGNGPWWVNEAGQLVREAEDVGVKKERPHLGSGVGVNRQRVHLGHSGQGVNRQLVHLGGSGQGVNRKIPHLMNNGRGSVRPTVRLEPWFNALAERLRRVRVCSGDWSRVCGPSVTFKHGLTGVFLDPPYAEVTGRDMNIYREDSLDVAHAVREWAIANGDNPLLRIALCGYDGEHEMPKSWAVHGWDAGAGYSGQGDESGENGKRERIWFSPACRAVAQADLFPAVET